MATEAQNHSVGYGKPPVHTRYMKGRSGNPKGRPPGSNNLSTILDAALNERVVVKENGKTRKITKRTAMIKQVVNKAASGDLKAVQFITNRINDSDSQNAGKRAAGKPPLAELLEAIGLTDDEEEKEAG
jgi:hypothetical protein